MDKNFYDSNLFDCNGIYLEPRLQEYIKKKKYYKENRIETEIPLEKEFNITKEDLRKIKALLRGDKDIYNHKKQDEYTDYVEMTGFEMDPDKMYKSDPRFSRYLKKVKRDKDALKQRDNVYNLDENYYDNILDDEYHEDIDEKEIMRNQKIKNTKNNEDYNDNYERYDKYINNKKNYDNFDNNDVTDYDYDINFSENSKLDTKFNNKYKYSNPFSSTSGRIYNNYPPTIQNKLKIHPMQNNKSIKNPTRHDYRIDKVIGNLETYGSKINNTYKAYRESDFDDEFKSSRPFVDCKNKKYINTSSYKKTPYMGRGDGQRDVAFESEMLYGKNSRTRNYSDKDLNQQYLEQNSGLPSRGTKSLGYNNPVEHYFDYITDDIQDPDHVVFERGIPTRLDNHAISRDRKSVV